MPQIASRFPPRYLERTNPLTKDRMEMFPVKEVRALVEPRRGGNVPPAALLRRAMAGLFNDDIGMTRGDG